MRRGSGRTFIGKSYLLDLCFSRNFLPDFLYALKKVRDVGVGQKIKDRKMHVKLVGNVAQSFRDQVGMSAQVKEVIHNSYPLQLKNFGENCRKSLLVRGAWLFRAGLVAHAKNF